MICPYCEQGGTKSLLYIGEGSSTKTPFRAFYDESGLMHAHDPNTHSVEYECSRGHRFKVSSRRRCPFCDYGSVAPTVEPL